MSKLDNSRAVVQCIGANFVNWLPTLFCGSHSQTDTELQQGPLLQGSLQSGRQHCWSILLSWLLVEIFCPDNSSSHVHMSVQRYPIHSHWMLHQESTVFSFVCAGVESEVSSKSQYTSSHHTVVVFHFDIDLLLHNCQTFIEGVEASRAKSRQSLASATPGIYTQICNQWSHLNITWFV